MNKHEVQDKVYYSLKGLYFACKEIQKWGRAHLPTSQMHPKEFATIKFCGTRRVGHSTAISRLINDFGMYAAIIVPDNRMYDNIVRTNPHFFRNKDSFAKCTVDDIMHGFSPRQIPASDLLDLVIIDNTAFLDDNKIERIYDAFRHSYNYAMEKETSFFWLFLG